METADVERLVRAYYERIDADDYEGVFELFADDVTYHRPGQTTVDGMQELRTLYLEERPLSDGEHRLHEVLVDGDTAAVRGRYVGTQGDETVDFEWADVHTFEDGVIVERHTYTDRDTI